MYSLTGKSSNVVYATAETKETLKIRNKTICNKIYNYKIMDKLKKENDSEN